MAQLQRRQSLKPEAFRAFAYSSPRSYEASIVRTYHVRKGSDTAVPATSNDSPLLLQLRASCCAAANRRWVPKAALRGLNYLVSMRFGGVVGVGEAGDTAKVSQR